MRAALTNFIAAYVEEYGKERLHDRYRARTSTLSCQGCVHASAISLSAGVYMLRTRAWHDFPDFSLFRHFQE